MNLTMVGLGWSLAPPKKQQGLLTYIYCTYISTYLRHTLSKVASIFLQYIHVTCSVNVVYAGNPIHRKEI